MIDENGRMGGRPIASVYAGMRVVDSAGAVVGTVEYVKMGDPEAVTTQGQELGPRTLLGEIVESIVGPEPDLPPTLAARLLRIGFVKVNGRGPFAADRYVASDEIAEVNGDTVHLAVPQERLSAES